MTWQLDPTYLSFLRIYPGNGYILQRKFTLCLSIQHNLHLLQFYSWKLFRGTWNINRANNKLKFRVLVKTPKGLFGKCNPGGIPAFSRGEFSPSPEIGNKILKFYTCFLRFPTGIIFPGLFNPDSQTSP